MIKIIDCKTSEVIEVKEGKMTNELVENLAQRYGKISKVYNVVGGSVVYLKNGKVLGFTEE